MIPIRRLWPVIATILSTQLAAMIVDGMFFDSPNPLFFNSIMSGTTTAGDTPVITNLPKKIMILKMSLVSF
jgi:hypothetical protein